MSRIQTILALLVAGAALGAVPALAAEAMPGAHGSADVSRAAPQVLLFPGKLTPKALPVVDAIALSRGLFDADPADALESLGTVTLSRDGGTTQTPASDTLRAIFAEESKGHHS